MNSTSRTLAIGPYSEGQIELRLPYADLKGIVKADYLP